METEESDGRERPTATYVKWQLTKIKISCILLILTGLVHLSYGTIGTLIIFKIYDFIPASFIGTCIRILYFSEKNTRYRLDYADMHSRSHIRLDMTTDSTQMTYASIILHFLLGIWIIANSYNVYSLVLKKRYNNCTVTTLIFSALCSLLMNFILVVINIVHREHTRTLEDLANFVNGQLVAVPVNPVTESAAETMACVNFTWGVTPVLSVIAIITLTITFRNVDKFKGAILTHRSRTTVPPVPQSNTVGTSRPRRFRNFPKRTHWNGLPRWDSLKDRDWYERRMARRMEQDAERANVSSANDNLPRSPLSDEVFDCTEENISIVHPGTGKYSIQFPESLMSIPQRMECLMSKENVPITLRTMPVNNAPRNVHLTRIPSISSITETPEITSIGHLDNKQTPLEVNSQKPWSYIPPNVNRMRDQLPADEELPPVPVPDYIVHPSYRKASVHRAGSTLSRELLTKLTHVQEKWKNTKRISEEEPSPGPSTQADKKMVSTIRGGFVK